MLTLSLVQKCHKTVTIMNFQKPIQARYLRLSIEMIPKNWRNHAIHQFQVWGPGTLHDAEELDSSHRGESRPYLLGGISGAKSAAGIKSEDFTHVDLPHLPVDIWRAVLDFHVMSRKFRLVFYRREKSQAFS